MEFVIIKTGGKQYKVKVGDVLDVDRLNFEKDKTIELSDVLLWANDSDLKIGKPNLDGATIKATVLDHKKGEKIRVAKFKAKARYRRVMGFRAMHTTLKIDDISIPGTKPTKKVESKPAVKTNPSKSK